MASYMEGDLEVEKGDQNGRIASGHVEAAGDRCKRRCVKRRDRGQVEVIWTA